MLSQKLTSQNVAKVVFFGSHQKNTKNPVLNIELNVPRILFAYCFTVAVLFLRRLYTKKCLYVTGDAIPDEAEGEDMKDIYADVNTIRLSICLLVQGDSSALRPGFC